MTGSGWRLLTATGLGLDFTPGPAVLFVLSSTLRVGARKGIASILGMLTASGIGVLWVSSYGVFAKGSGHQ